VPSSTSWHGDRQEEIFRDDRHRWKFLAYLVEGAERYRSKCIVNGIKESRGPRIVDKGKTGQLSEPTRSLGVSEHFQSDLERFKERSIRSNLARRCAITLCWDHAGLSHDEIAALFRMPSSNSVTQMIRRTETHVGSTLKVLKHQIVIRKTAGPYGLRFGAKLIRHRLRGVVGSVAPKN
jgi:hypothetical protein